MELHHLRCFVAAAEQLHFGRAAQQLQMLPSALGRQIKLLEDDLGTRLFARTTRAVSLTEDGASLLRDAEVLATGADPAAVANKDSPPALEVLAAAYKGERGARAFAAVDQGLIALDRNAGVKIVADWVALQL